METITAWSLCTVKRHTSLTFAVPILLFLGVLELDPLTLSPGMLGGDPGELQFVPAILGLPHPTGMPLYVLLGKAWSLLPLGHSVAWRMNLLAAVSAVLAVVLVFRTVYALVGKAFPALGAALLLAVGATFWSKRSLPINTRSMRCWSPWC